MKEPLFKIDRQHHFQHNRFCLKANLGISPLLCEPAWERLVTFPLLTLLLVLGGAGSVPPKPRRRFRKSTGRRGLRAGVLYTSAFGDDLGRAELEYQTPIRGLALTAEAAKGDHGYDHLLFGVRYYFGSKKSLRDRQRQDDPPGFMQQVLQGLGLYGRNTTRRATRICGHRGILAALASTDLLYWGYLRKS